MSRRSDLSNKVGPVEIPKAAELEGNSGQSLAHLKALVRYDIMEEISIIMSDLVAIDLKYSEFTRTCEREVREDAIAEAPDLRPNVGHRESPLEDLHAFTVAELRGQLGHVQNFIRELDAKYSDIAETVQKRIQKLEQLNTELYAEVERLRHFY